MAENVDVQELTIGVGTVIAVLLLGYGTFLNETLFGIETLALAIGAFAATFVAVGVLHGAYGRTDFALAHVVAGVGLAVVGLASSVLQLMGGYVLLLIGGGYVVLETVRARNQ
ncbi:hypothetical protein [Natronobacterium gregoryi]|uniref:Permease n=2 Tax=Natronobacterium gregoryi TaxID=44930 RepID=L0AGW8_NATGS|nr:hypothetical protein [Natronobacterium gregoryi]AFZ72335.1 hypothetical protein Natgr_1107 [Natronobacterium gregoryi SP2]ELY64279.1 hypothetical protein C490_14860 [Natronobacterium gregoryi SP2]PLK20348.1 hypothetical protein CYV19_10320 [Natronobacterium gregoryi SP2]SFJ23219.1 hypothetical protein SAMN05443661_11862 [Natronobacterium gregoryi]